MPKHVIISEGAAAPVGPYSQALMCGDFVFVSGQIPIDPETGEMIEGDMAAQTQRALQNLQLVLRGAGLAPYAVVKTTVYLADMDSFDAFNEVYANFFPESPPARSCVEVSRLPKGALIEVEAVAMSA